MPDFLWKWRKEIIFSLLILVSFGLLVSRRKPDVISQSLRQGVALLIAPVQKVSASSVRGVRESLSVLASLGRLRRENAELAGAVRRLQLDNARLREQARENEILRTELEYRRRTRWAFIPAEVIGCDPASWLERRVVNRGSTDGVVRGAGVIAPEGVVGRVSEVTLYTATIMLLPDTQSSVAGVIERSRVPGTIKGFGKPRLGMMHVSGSDDVRAGDTVLTSNVSSIYPPGLAIGEVTGARPAETGLMLSIQVRPRVNFKTLDRVLILREEP